MSKTLKWFLKLLVYPFLLLKQSSSLDASEREIFSNALWFIIGIVPVSMTAMLVVVKMSAVGNEFPDGYFWSCLFANVIFYLAVGILSFFTNPVANDPSVSWQDNGRW